MASFNIMGGGLKLPDVEVMLLNNGASNTIQCNVGDFIIVDMSNEVATKVSVTSGGIVVGRTSYLTLIKATSSTLVIQLSGAVYNTAWGTLIKKPKVNFSNITEISSNTEYTNIAKDSIIYTRGDNCPVGILKLSNVIIFSSGATPQGYGRTNPVVSCTIDSTNDFKFYQTQNALTGCYIS